VLVSGDVAGRRRFGCASSRPIAVCGRTSGRRRVVGRASMPLPEPAFLDQDSDAVVVALIAAAVAPASERQGQ
jgi:hypothetical protein